MNERAKVSILSKARCDDPVIIGSLWVHNDGDTGIVVDSDFEGNNTKVSVYYPNCDNSGGFAIYHDLECFHTSHRYPFHGTITLTS